MAVFCANHSGINCSSSRLTSCANIAWVVQLAVAAAWCFFLLVYNMCTQTPAVQVSLLLSQVAEGSLSDGDYSQAASSFATAAALYAKGMSESAPATADSFLSSSSSDTSEDTTLAQFFPLHETAGKPDKAPVPDQSWWEEFGEWECASKVSHLPAHVTSPTQPRLVCGDHIVRLPIVRSDARLPYASFTGLLDAAAPTVSITHAIHQHDAVKVSAQFGSAQAV